MKTYRIAEARAQLGDLVDLVRVGEPVEIRGGKYRAAYLVDVDAYERLVRLRDAWGAARIRQALEGPMYPLEELLAKLDLDDPGTGD